MTTSKYDNIWKCLSSNDFKKEIPEKFFCIICKNVTIEPYVASCECRFCYKCIEEFIKDGRKNCPGEKSECKEDILEMNVNVLRDIVSIRCIAQLKVKCPNDMCEARRTLDNMSDHIRICGMNSKNCLFQNFGCDAGQILKDKIKTHYDDEWFTHSQLLVESIDVLRNEVNRLSQAMERKDKEMNKLQENVERNEVTMIEMKRQIEEQGRQIDVLKNHSERKEINIQKKEIDLLKNKDRKKESDIKQIKDEFRNIKETQKKMMENVENVKKNIWRISVSEDGENVENGEEDENENSIENKMSSVIMKVEHSRIYDEREFIWRVDNFSKISDCDGWRDVILWKYSRKFCLSLRCTGNFIGYSCRIMKGDLDNYLEWPMKHKITLSVINQDTMKIHKSIEYCYTDFKYKECFHKPKDVLRNFLGNNTFMTIKDIMEFPGFLVNDSLVVSFNIDYKS